MNGQFKRKYKWVITFEKKLSPVNNKINIVGNKQKIIMNRFVGSLKQIVKLPQHPCILGPCQDPFY